MSEVLEKALKIIKDLEDTLKDTTVSYSFSVGEDRTYIAGNRATDVEQALCCLSAIISSAGSLFVSNGFPLEDFMKLVDEAKGLALEKLSVEAPEGKLIVGPWGEG